MTQFTPESLSSEINLPGLVRYISRQLQLISDALAGIQDIALPTLHVEPKRRPDGLVVLADGTDWNPGSGKGIYCYYSGAWHYLG